MKIAAQLYNVREHTKTAPDIEATLKRVKSIGYDVIQISGFGSYDPVMITSWVKEIGLEVCITHTPWQRLADPIELNKVITEHKNMSCPIIGLGARPGEGFDNSFEGWSSFIKKLNEITRQVKGEGLDFSYHNHEFEFEKWNGKTAMHRLIEEVPDMLITLDIFWVQAGGANPLSLIKNLQGRIKVIHFKDFRIINGKRQFAEIGQGNFDWSEIISLCKSTGISYAAIEQDGDFLVNPFESLAMSLDFLKSFNL